MVLGAFLCVCPGCQDGGASGNGVPKEPEFRADGVLAFTRPDGTTITRIAIEIAETREAQATGLMGRRSLPARGGMLFWNDAPRMQSFWMKNTPLPLDIIFIRSDSTITNIVKRTRPLSEDRIKSTEEAQYVLEVRAGFTDRFEINESTRLRWWRRDELEPKTST